ncbi:hypothetical protein BJ878DRAFT_414183, partial [Calycina marina]
EQGGVDEIDAGGSVHDPNVSLEPMDWDSFDEKYKDKFEKMSATEEQLIDEFAALCKSFSFWAAAAGNVDEARGLKRLKTRQRYVQMAERDLMEKKQHYERVVEAFKTALELLGK